MFWANFPSMSQQEKQTAKVVVNRQQMIKSHILDWRGNGCSVKLVCLPAKFVLIRFQLPFSCRSSPAWEIMDGGQYAALQWTDFCKINHTYDRPRITAISNILVEDLIKMIIMIIIRDLKRKCVMRLGVNQWDKRKLRSREKCFQLTKESNSITVHRTEQWGKTNKTELHEKEIKATQGTDWCEKRENVECCEAKIQYTAMCRKTKSSEQCDKKHGIVPKHRSHISMTKYMGQSSVTWQELMISNESKRINLTLMNMKITSLIIMMIVWQKRKSIVTKNNDRTVS